MVERKNVFIYRSLKTSKFIVGKLTVILKARFLKSCPIYFYNTFLSLGGLPSVLCRGNIKAKPRS